MATKIKLKASTRANYLYLWEQYIKNEPLANKPIGTIHKSEILSLYTKLLKKGFATNSLESINNLMPPTLEMAVDDDYIRIRKNPSKGVYRSLKNDGTALKPELRIALTRIQQQNFLRFAAKRPTYCHWLPVLVTLAGARRCIAECTGLTWDDVDFENNSISVNHNLICRVIDGKAGFHITTPKTRKGTRTIPILFPEVTEQLRSLYEVQEILYPGPNLVLEEVFGFVFRNRFGSFPSAHNIHKAVMRICTEYNMAEIDQPELEDREPELIPHFSVHNLRHTFCTRLCEMTSGIKFIQQVMGRAGFSATIDIYTHITKENMQSKVKNISGQFKLL